MEYLFWLFGFIYANEASSEAESIGFIYKHGTMLAYRINHADYYKDNCECPSLDIPSHWIAY